MDPISIGLGAIQGLSSLGGLLGGEAARRRAEAARQAALNNLAASTDADYNNLVQNNRQGLLSATGLGGDAIQSLGRNLGSAMAGAGVYNSSATAGALQQATGQEQAQLGQLAGNNYANEQGLLNQNRRYLSQMQLGLANQQYGEAQQNLQGSRNGLSSLLGSLGQFNLARSGANQMQNALPRPLGGYGADGPLVPGAGLSFNGATNTFNPNGLGSGVTLNPLGQVYKNALSQKQQFGVGGYNPNGL